MIKKFFTAIFVFAFLASLFGTNDHVHAATFSCMWDWSDADPNNECIIDPNAYGCPGATNDPSNPVVVHCNGFNGNETGCGNANGYCPSCNAPNVCLTGSSCPSPDYNPGAGDCISGSQVCCIEAAITPPPATECWACAQPGLGANYCYNIGPQPDGTCGPYWLSESTCESPCVDNSYSSYTCNLNMIPMCQPAAYGEYTGPYAGIDCLSSCSLSEPPTIGPDKCAGGQGLVTAIGCIRVLMSGTNADFGPLAGLFLLLGMGIGGGIAFVLIVYAGFMVTTSSGNPQKLAAGKELLTAAVMGLLMLVFAAFILRFIGRDVLNLDQIGF